MSTTTTDTNSKRFLAEAAMRRSWFPVARIADLGKPQTATLLGTNLVIFRDGAGDVAVLDRRCPHRGADLSKGEVHEKSIGCPYHGWEFGTGTGACVRVPSLADQAKIPARAGVKSYPVELRYGHVWTVLEDPIRPVYDVARWKDLDLEWLAGPVMDSAVGVGITIENFRDVAHFPFVHKVSMGPTPEVVEPLAVTRDGLDIHMERELNAGTGEWAEDGDAMMYYECSAPGLATITYNYERLGHRIVAGFPCPVDYNTVKIFWGVANEVGYKGAGLEECLRIEEIVYREDLPIVEGMDPREIPWDAEVQEFSVPADMFTLNFRRSFNELISRAKTALESEKEQDHDHDYATA